MSKTTPEEAKALAEKLRQVCNQVRGKSYALADLIPLLQQTADFIDEVRGVDAEPVAWTPGPNEFKDWCSRWFGPDSDDDYLAKAVFNLPLMAQKFETDPAPSQPAAPVEEGSDDLTIAYMAGFSRGKEFQAAQSTAPVELPVVALPEKFDVKAYHVNTYYRDGYNQAIDDAQAAIAAGRKAS